MSIQPATPGRKFSESLCLWDENMTGKIEALVRECQRQAENCLYTSTALYEAIKCYGKIYKSVSIAAGICGGLAAWSVLSDQKDPTIKIAVAAFALVSGLIPELLKKINFSEEIVSFRSAASDYKNLQDRFRQAAQITSYKGFSELDREFTLLMDRMEALRKNGIAVPEWAFKKAQTKIKSGDYTFDVDLADLKKILGESGS